MRFALIHQGLILAGFAGIAVSVSSAVLYLIQSAQLKSRHPGRILLALPSLEKLDRVHFRALSFGLILFSLGLFAGVSRVTDPAGLLRAAKDPTVVLSMISCAFYWIILVVRASALRRGHKIAMGTLLVFIFLLATVVGTYTVPTGPHGGL